MSQPISCQVADEFRPLLAETKAVLEKAVASIEGAMVEDNKYALSIHYRNVRADQVEHVRAVVSAHLESQPTLCLKHGKKVFELRPKVDDANLNKSKPRLQHVAALPRDFNILSNKYVEGMPKLSCHTTLKP